jgi:hypothetical protein
MLDPWESLKVNERRQMLGGVRQGGNQFDLYDIGGNCLDPQLLFSGPVGLDDGSGGFVAAVTGHEGNFAPDGLTYYGANLGNGYIYPIDISNPTKPKMLTQYSNGTGNVHGLDISDDGNRAYLAIAGQGAANPNRAPWIAGQQWFAHSRYEPGSGAGTESADQGCQCIGVGRRQHRAARDSGQDRRQALRHSKPMRAAPARRNSRAMQA